MAIEARFIDGSRGRIFVLLHTPQHAAGGGPCVLVAPPFGEELNKCRRMIAVVAHTLAQAGVATVWPDYYGTGDSEGEFRDASWELWLDDLLRTTAWAQERGWTVSSMLGVRLGCMAAARLAASLSGGLRRCVFWQPTCDGERFTTQFLRLRVAASMMADRKETVAELRQQLLAAQTVEVAGYELTAPLIEQIDRERLGDTIGAALGELHWMEVVRDAEAPLPQPSSRVIEVARQRLRSVATHRIVGEPFWSSTEIVLLPELVNRTVETLATPA
jgi:exosortase A-associated hydrolase 2